MSAITTNNAENLQIISKAYEIDRNRIYDGHYWNAMVCYADTRNEAKMKLLFEFDYEDLKLRSEYPLEEAKKLTYLNIPVKRKKNKDRVLFEGREMLRDEVIELINESKRIAKFNEILSNDTIKYCYIKKNDNYYCPNYCGYTLNKEQAGVYPKKDAVSHAKGCEEISLECVDVENHNKRITDKIAILQSFLIL